MSKRRPILTPDERKARARRVLERVGFDMTAEHLAALPPALWLSVKPPMTCTGDAR